MAQTFQVLFNTLRPTLNDSAKTRYPDAELLTYAIDGLRESALLRPDLFETTDTMTCAAGVDQEIPSTGLFLIDVLRVVDGDDILEADYHVMRAFNPAWRNAEPGPAELWMRYPKDKSKQDTRKFLVSPPALDTQELEIEFAELDVASLTLNSNVPLPEEYHPALEAYVIFRAESKDDEHVNSNRAVQFRAAFEAALGVGEQTEETKP